MMESFFYFLFFILKEKISLKCSLFQWFFFYKKHIFYKTWLKSSKFIQFFLILLISHEVHGFFSAFWSNFLMISDNLLKGNLGPKPKKTPIFWPSFFNFVRARRGTFEVPYVCWVRGTDRTIPIWSGCHMFVTSVRAFLCLFLLISKEKPKKHLFLTFILHFPARI